MSPDQFKRYFCYAVIIVLTAAVIGLSVALSGANTKKVTIENKYACPNGWIGFGSKCFYFSEDMGNWTFSQSSCMELGAELARFDNMEELIFLMRYKDGSTYWIGLHRKSAQHPWRWTDNTDYNNLVSTRGEGEHAYLSDRGVSSGRDNPDRKWICSKPNSYLQCPEVLQLVPKQS